LVANKLLRYFLSKYLKGYFIFLCEASVLIFLTFFHYKTSLK
jgi:hypothetical protein